MDEIKNESWNKKKIFTAFFLIGALIVLGYFLKTKVLDEGFSPMDSLKSVKGITSTKRDNKEMDEKLNINVQKAVQEKIESLQQDVKGLNIVEIASSSPQLQKIINDIKSLEQYPVNQAREFCKQICSF